MSVVVLLIYLGGVQATPYREGPWRPFFWPYYLGKRLSHWAFDTRAPAEPG